MIIFTAILFAVIGWLVAMFINHASNRLPLRQPVLRQSVCPNCELPYTLTQYSAIIAKLTDQTHCANCRQPLPRFTRSLIVELVTPLMLAFLVWRFGLTWELVMVAIYTLILILITVTDLEHRLIFNVVVLPAIALAALASLVVPGYNWRTAFVGGIGAFIVVYLAALLSRGGLGEGDVTLSTFLGFAMGFPHIVLSITFGVFLGGFVALLLLLSGRVNLKTFIPYGPFLTLTGWIMLVWGDEIWQYYFF